MSCIAGRWRAVRRDKPPVVCVHLIKSAYSRRVTLLPARFLRTQLDGNDNLLKLELCWRSCYVMRLRFGK